MKDKAYYLHKEESPINPCENCRENFQALKNKIILLTKNNLENKSLGWEEREQAYRAVIHAMKEVERAVKD